MKIEESGFWLVERPSRPIRERLLDPNHLKLRGLGHAGSRSYAHIFVNPTRTRASARVMLLST